MKNSECVRGFQSRSLWQTDVNMMLSNRCIGDEIESPRMCIVFYLPKTSYIQIHPKPSKQQQRDRERAKD